MNSQNDRGAWSPYVAGALSGLLAVASVLVAGKYLGASTTFVRGAGMLERVFSPEAVATLTYYLKEKPIFDWQYLFVVGIFAGAFLAARLGRDFTVQAVPDMWRERFGKAKLPRAATAFVGGVVAMYGARLAGGCPSGHGLSGLAQLSVSGFVAAACFFLGGIVMARLVYGRS
ncbi:MAG TPA: YeeE/YedE thiosulfate transporter family protein [Spirochaetales bacterium]|nr:YeeE/YedE thiosulfate transporter family protein [Spirochaetales bacterium]